MPLSNEFELVQVSSITVPSDRQRKNIKSSKVDALAGSIKRNGLLHPIVIKRDCTLVAGERRLLAHIKLGREKIPVHWFDELDQFEAAAIELEENLRRVDLTWKEICLATLQYHEVREKSDSTWTRAATSEALGLSLQHTSKLCSLAKALKSGNELVTIATNMDMAYNSIQRSRQRAVQTELAQVDLTILEVKGETKEASSKPIDTPPEETTAPEAKSPNKILNREFIEWAEAYSGRRFNFLHCDFPYGIKLNTTTYNGSQAWKKYPDSKEIYFALLDCLCTNVEKLLFPSAHLMLWFSMNYYCETVNALEKAGFAVNPYPLFWHKDRGIVPDPKRGPKRVYETALLASLGDRMVIRSPLNAMYHVVNKERHISTKPKAVLHHFFRMLVDGSTEMLDPTCGSGTALAAAIGLGAKRVVGIDVEQEHCETSSIMLEEAERRGLVSVVEDETDKERLDRESGDFPI